MLKSEETMKNLLNIMDLSNIKNELTFQIRMSPGFNSGTEIFQFENGQKCCYFKQYFENGKPSTIKYLYQIYYPKYCIQNIEKYSKEKRIKAKRESFNDQFHRTPRNHFTKTKPLIPY